jgi:RimJ/RimL family protein N-acetyltransferase
MTAPLTSQEHLVLATGPNVRIRMRVRSDGPDEFRWRSDPENARFDGREPNREPFQAFIDAFGYELAYGRNDREQFAIDDAGGRHIGTVMLYNFGRGGDSAEFGITLGEETFRGKGVGREAVILLLRWAWANRPLRSVHLHALAWNERAIRCFEAAGFHPTVRVSRDGQELVRMEVRREWWLLWEMEGRFLSGTDSGNTVPGNEPASTTPQAP